MVSMLGVGLVWSLVRGWELTFVGFAITPVIHVVMAFQTKLVADCELRNKAAQEEVAMRYYEVRHMFVCFFVGLIDINFRLSATLTLPPANA